MSTKTYCADIQVVGFPGFYNSPWGDLEDRELEQLRDRLRDDYDIDDDLADEIQFTPSYIDRSRKASAEYVAKEYAHQLQTMLGIDITVKAVTIDSPKYYNFTTDKIIMTVEFGATLQEIVEKLQQLSSEWWDLFKETVKANHTSYDGFWSFMSNDASEWWHKMRQEYDLYLDYALAYAFDAWDKNEYDGGGLKSYFDALYEFYDEGVAYDFYDYNDVEVFWNGDMQIRWDEFKEKARNIDWRRELDRNTPVIPGLFDE